MKKFFETQNIFTILTEKHWKQDRPMNALEFIEALAEAREFGFWEAREIYTHKYSDNGRLGYGNSKAAEKVESNKRQVP